MEKKSPEKKELITISVNGVPYTRAVSQNMTLLEFLREEINLTGTKRGCDLGECGVCTVIADDRAILSCITPALVWDGREVRTIEGLAGSGTKLHPVQKAFLEHGALQCGFCTPGMIMNVVNMLEHNPLPNENEIKECVSGTICRCTGYTKIIKAVEIAASTMQNQKL